MLVGQGKRALIGRPFYQLFPQAIAGRLALGVRQLVATGKSVCTDYKLLFGIIKAIFDHMLARRAVIGSLTRTTDRRC